MGGTGLIECSLQNTPWFGRIHHKQQLILSPRRKCLPPEFDS